jgi:hypothetical protein
MAWAGVLGNFTPEQTEGRTRTGVKRVIAKVRRALGMQRGQLAGRYVPHWYYV